MLARVARLGEGTNRVEPGVRFQLPPTKHSSAQGQPSFLCARLRLVVGLDRCHGRLPDTARTAVWPFTKDHRRNRHENHPQPRRTGSARSARTAGPSCGARPHPDLFADERAACAVLSYDYTVLAGTPTTASRRCCARWPAVTGSFSTHPRPPIQTARRCRPSPPSARWPTMSRSSILSAERLDAEDRATAGERRKFLRGAVLHQSGALHKPHGSRHFGWIDPQQRPGVVGGDLDHADPFGVAPAPKRGLARRTGIGDPVRAGNPLDHLARAVDGHRRDRR